MRRLFLFLTSLRLASVLLFLLLLLTLFGTLEQVEYGLYQTIQKYFTWRNAIVLPDITINGKLVPLPLPGAYWVSALLCINMILGGIVKLRKGWKKAGVLLSHFGIVLLLLGGFVTHHFSQRGNMALYEGESSDYAQAYHEHSIEVSLLDEVGLPREVYVIADTLLRKVAKAGERGRSIKVEGLPFQLEVSHYLKNCRPRHVGPVAAGQTPIVDGYALFQAPLQKEDEANLNGCYVKASTGDELLLFSAAFEPYVLTFEGERYAISLRKSIWNMPFHIALQDFNAEFFPTGKPKKFESFINRVEGELSEQVKIYMNHPMRYKGYTFFQASWGPQQGGTGQRLYSVFEVVKNPADQWPLYSIVITTIGLLWHFGMTLGRFILKQTRKKALS